MKRLLTLLSWLLLLQTPVSAQHDGVIWNYEHLSRNDGLSGNRVTALCDDAYGRIWIGTSQGLNIYDGRRLQKVEEYNGLEVWSFHDTGRPYPDRHAALPRGVRLRQRPFLAPDLRGPRRGVCAHDRAGRGRPAAQDPEALYRCDGRPADARGEGDSLRIFLLRQIRAAVGAFQGAGIPHRRGFQRRGDL